MPQIQDARKSQEVLVLPMPDIRTGTMPHDTKESTGWQRRGRMPRRNREYTGRSGRRQQKMQAEATAEDTKRILTNPADRNRQSRRYLHTTGRKNR